MDHEIITLHTGFRRGAFKRHLRKHTSLFQREGGHRAKGFLVTCDQGKEAASITAVSRFEYNIRQNLINNWAATFPAFEFHMNYCHGFENVYRTDIMSQDPTARSE
jgi:hypothetical protein